MLDYNKSFIEVQFPVSKISKESYKERMSGASQTLTGLGKWWGRKPLILVRATLLGLLMPISDDFNKDKSIFLKILAMDDDSLLERKNKSIPISVQYEVLSQFEKDKYFIVDSLNKPTYKNDVTSMDKSYLQKLAFNRLSYNEKLQYCVRPENFDVTNENVWNEINSHLETNAQSINQLVEELGIKRFGRRPKVGDCFAGGGSIPFETARIGAEIYASDLNPVASLLNWSALNLSGINEEELSTLVNFQSKLFAEIDEKIKEWGIEENEVGHRADSFLYCHETTCPECGIRVPLSPSWAIDKNNNIYVNLVNEGSHFNFEIITDATPETIHRIESKASIVKSNMVCPNCQQKTPLSSIRGDVRIDNKRNVSGVRLWEKNEFIPRESDVFNERLYAIRYVNNKSKYYVAPTNEDLNRENKVIELLAERFDEWQDKGYIPTIKIDSGEKTDEPIRTRGWQYWHQLFCPRQLLINGMIMEHIDNNADSKSEYAIGMLIINKVADWGSKLCVWHTTRPDPQNTFLNQALNALYNYGVRGFTKLEGMIKFQPFVDSRHMLNEVRTIDARKLDYCNDIWITDPPYADAVNYHELTEFFLAWDRVFLEKSFPEWHTDSRRILAVKGVGQSFNDSMIDIYKNLANHMPDNGYQVVMFTHQDVKVWSELSMILWSAGLRVVSAWNISTETESGGLKAGGNYVSGTVLLTLKKQVLNEIAFQDELYDEIKSEVKNIIDSMKDIDDKDDPDFTDADYLLASYASSLKVLTKYKEIEGIDVPYWLAQPRDSKEENPVETLINKAVRIAYDYLIPEGFEKGHWADLNPEERFYIRGLEVEMNGSSKISAYQELARGFGVSDYQDMFENFKANQARLKTPSEYRMSGIGGHGFGNTLLRHLLVAINETVENQSTEPGRAYLRNIFKEDNQYWYKKPLMIEILTFISKLEFTSHMKHWHEHAKYARILRESLKNEGV